MWPLYIEHGYKRYNFSNKPIYFTVNFFSKIFGITVVFARNTKYQKRMSLPIVVNQESNLKHIYHHNQTSNNAQIHSNDLRMILPYVTVPRIGG